MDKKKEAPTKFVEVSIVPVWTNKDRLDAVKKDVEIETCYLLEIPVDALEGIFPSGEGYLKAEYEETVCEAVRKAVIEKKDLKSAAIVAIAAIDEKKVELNSVLIGWAGKGRFSTRSIEARENWCGGHIDAFQCAKDPKHRLSEMSIPEKEMVIFCPNCDRELVLSLMRA